VYRQRATHVAGLCEFGARVEKNGNRLTVRVPSQLSAADVKGWDIRCATALLLAALAADGDRLSPESTISAGVTSSSCPNSSVSERGS
jgi:UDP-N-acetylglucosamine enolpyruvyl transferase